MITREKQLFHVQVMIQPFIVIEATNFHEDKNHVK